MKQIMYKRLLIKIFEVTPPNGRSPGYLNFGSPYTGNQAVVTDILCENAAAWIFLGPVSQDKSQSGSRVILIIWPGRKSEQLGQI